MDEPSPLVYGLEFQARALASRQAESNDVRFFIATQSLKPNNQLHVVDVHADESSELKASGVFAHRLGEVWKLNASPHDERLLVSCYSVLQAKGATAASPAQMQTALLKLPESFEAAESCNDSRDTNTPIRQDGDEFLQFENVEVLKTEGYGSEIRTTEFHPSDNSSLCTVIDGKVLLFNRAEASTRLVAEISGGKNSQKFSGGRWSLFSTGNQFITLLESSIRAYDVREPNHAAWIIKDAHSQLVRDLDCNPNKPCHIVTGGDDGMMKIWDFRNPREHLFARSDHHHWIWNVRFNPYHDQLILSSSSDGQVLLTCAGSVSSDTLQDHVDQDERKESSGGDDHASSEVDLVPVKERLPDGLLQTFDQHEDSVYCVEWSAANPWLFASLSYDGRMIVSKVRKQYKYQILL